MSSDGTQIAYVLFGKDMCPCLREENPWLVGEEREAHEYYISFPNWLEAMQSESRTIPGIVEISKSFEVTVISGDHWQSSKITKLLAVGRESSKEFRLFTVECAERAMAAEMLRGNIHPKEFRDSIEAGRRFANGLITSEELKRVNDLMIPHRLGLWPDGAAYGCSLQQPDQPDALNNAASTVGWDTERPWQVSRLQEILFRSFSEFITISIRPSSLYRAVPNV